MRCLSNVSMLFFDMDGTLFSTRDVLCSVYERAVETFGELYPQCSVQCPDCERLCSLVGSPPGTILRTLFPDLSDVMLRALGDILLGELVEAVRARSGALFEGVVETLVTLFERAYVLFLASYAPRQYISAVLKTYGLLELFQPVIVVDNLAVSSKTQLLQAYQRIYQFAPHQAVMIGDRGVDLRAAQDLGFSFVGCSYGFAQPQELQNARVCIPRFRDLLSLLQ